MLASSLSLSAKPVPSPDPDDAPVILTPKPGPAPRLNGPTISGARPGHPFLYRIPCQGTRPITFSADGLPASLTLDAATGIITGTTPAAGTHRITLHAKCPHGESTRLFRQNSLNDLDFDKKASKFNSLNFHATAWFRRCGKGGLGRLAQ